MKKERDTMKYTQLYDNGELGKTSNKVAYKGKTIRKWCEEHKEMRKPGKIWEKYYCSETLNPPQDERYYNILRVKHGKDNEYVIRRDSDFEHTIQVLEKRLKDWENVYITNDGKWWFGKNPGNPVLQTGEYIREWCMKYKNKYPGMSDNIPRIIYEKYFSKAIKNKPSDSAFYGIYYNPNCILTKDSVCLIRVQEQKPEGIILSKIQEKKPEKIIEAETSIGYRKSSVIYANRGNIKIFLVEKRCLIQYRSRFVISSVAWANSIMEYILGTEEYSTLDEDNHIFAFTTEEGVVRIYQIMTNPVLDVRGCEIKDIFEVKVFVAEVDRYAEESTELIDTQAHIFRILDKEGMLKGDGN